MHVIVTKHTDGKCRAIKDIVFATLYNWILHTQPNTTNRNGIVGFVFLFIIRFNIYDWNRRFVAELLFLGIRIHFNYIILHATALDKIPTTQCQIKCEEERVTIDACFLCLMRIYLKWQPQMASIKKASMIFPSSHRAGVKRVCKYVCDILANPFTSHNSVKTATPARPARIHIPYIDI